jgi:iron(III) transport system substrate-binding protein
VRRIITIAVVAALVGTACSGDDGATTLTVYSGRSEELVGPLFEQFTAETGIGLEVRYAGSTDLAATIREEGDRSPADVFLAQDPASLGAVAIAGLFDPLPELLVDEVDPRFSDRERRWVGVSGRARVVVYDATRLSESDLPDDVTGFTDAAWQGRVAIAPGNGSFLAFVAAMVVMEGEEATRAWLEGMAANQPVRFEGNSPIVAAVDQGEIEVGLVNHDYLLRLIAEQGSSDAANHFLASGGPGSLVMPSGAGILASSDETDAAKRFIEFLLGSEAQRYFAEQTFEYPLAAGVAPATGLPPLETLGAPDLDLSALAAALDVATDLVAEAGLL